MTRINRGWLAFVHDLVMTALSFPLSLAIRLGPDFSQLSSSFLIQHTALFVALAAPIYWLGGLYRGIWRYASLNDMFAILRAVTVQVLAFEGLLFMLTRLEAVPRSTMVINWFLLAALLGAPRLAYRVFKDRRLDHLLEHDTHRRIPVLLVGATDGTELFIREMRRDRHANYEVVGIVSASGNRVGRSIHNQRVLGGIEDIPAIVERLGTSDRRPQRLILTTDNVEPAIARRLVETAEGLGIGLARMPRVTDFRNNPGGADAPIALRPIDLEDLLGRPQHALDLDRIAGLVRGRRILITGAGGTIGAELTRQITALGPAELTLVELSEYALYQIDLEIGEKAPALPRTAVIADVRDRLRLERVVVAARPEIVFHAAALKHVPMVEANPLEGLRTNALGTRNLAEICRAAGVGTMVMISTDKAVHPVNVMGASKRLAESICQSLDLATAGKPGTRFVTVRFGNVLGSTGSVVPLFQRQLAAGGPLTVTHPDVIRYFMTVREAVELVLQAASVGNSDAGRIFVLEMGDPVKIVDLARQMIRLAGLRPDVDVKIAFVGMRPGEKMHEALFYENEALEKTDFPGLLLATPQAADYAMLSRGLDELEEMAAAQRIDRALAILRRLVPEYRANSKLPPAGVDTPVPARLVRLP